MEVLKKTVLMALTTGLTTTTSGNSYIIVPDLTAIYYFKIGLTAEMPDLGFFDAYVEPVIPEPPPIPPQPGETYYYVDANGDVFIDANGDNFIWE